MKPMDEFFGIWNHPKWPEPVKLKLATRLTACLDSEYDRVPKVYLDFESYYDPANGYGLRAMTYEQYIRDPRFQVILASFYIPETGERYWVPNYNGAVRKELESLRLQECDVISHNAPFDSFILADYYGIEPLEISCTLTMARPLHGIKAANDLERMAQRYFLPSKGTEVHNVQGLRLEDFTKEGMQRYGDYGQRDTDLLAPLYGLFRLHYQEQDMITMSDSIRAGAVCQIELDVPLLEAYLPKLEKLQAEKVQKIGAMLMAECGHMPDFPDVSTDEAMKKALGSSIQFGRILNGLGYEIPMKDSKTAKNEDGTPKRTPALAKNDMGFKELLRSEDDVLVALCEARMGEKSTLGRTRAQSLINIGSRGRMPFPVKPFGAGTGRWTAYQDINCFTPGHELLTREGWVKVEDYQPGMALAQWWDDGRITWDYAPGWLIKPHAGDVIDIDSPMVSAIVTPDHRLASVSQATGKVVYHTAQWVAEHSGLDSIPLCGELVGEDVCLPDCMLQYLVALQADGNVTSSGAHHFGFKKERKIHRMRTILNTLGWKYREAVGDVTYFYIPENNQSQLVKLIGKGFGRWLLDLSSRQLSVICDEVVYWDGNLNSNNGQMEYSSREADQVVWLNTAMRLCGRRGAEYVYPRKNGYADVHRLYERKSPYGSIDTERQVFVRPYSGLVYCPKVDSGIVIVRHRGRIFMSPQCQNFPKRGGDKTLRRAMKAPPGFELVTCDLSQIEARRMADHANQMDLLKQFENNEDPYSQFATRLYGYEVSKHNGKKTERNVGKECILSLQYTSWFESFWLRLRTAYDMDVSKEFCRDAVLLYRDHYKNIVNYWDECQNALDVMVSGGRYEFGYERNYVAEKGRIILPDGWVMKYEGLAFEGQDDLGRPVLMYTDRENRKRRKIYRGIVANNTTQGSSARILMYQMRDLREDGIIWAGTVHDELIFLVPKCDLQDWCGRIEQGMHKRPDWAHRTPIDCELTVGENYADQYDLDVWLAGGRTTLGAEAEIKRRKQAAMAAQES